jgi:hypothetical protein
MDKEIIAVIIGGAAIVTAALIGSLAVYIKRRRATRKTTPPLKHIKQQEQRKSSESTLDIPIPGHIPRDQLPEFRIADSIKDLRENTQVRQLTSEENQLTLRELPNGVFGFIEAYKLDYPSWRIIKKAFIDDNFILKKCLLLVQRPTFGNFVEIHKSGNGNIYLVGFVTEEDRITLQNPLRSQSTKIVISISKHEKRNIVVAIPRERLEWWRQRELGDGQCIGHAIIS